MMEYDDKGNLIHSKASNGYEQWYEYDDRGNLIHRKTSDEYEQWYKYDDKGNIIHFKDQQDDGSGNEWWYKWGVVIKKVKYPPKKGIEL